MRVWGQNVAVGSVIVPLGSEHNSGEVLTLTRKQDGWTPGVKFSSTYLLAVASSSPLPELPDYSTLVDIGLELVHTTENQRDQAQSELANVLELLGASEAEREQARNEAARLLELLEGWRGRARRDQSRTVSSGRARGYGRGRARRGQGGGVQALGRTGRAVQRAFRRP